MAFKLTKTEMKDRDEHIELLRALEERLRDSIEAANVAISEAVATVNAEIAKYNEKLWEAAEFVQDIAGRADDEYNEKSERWQDGDKGRAAADWLAQWRDMDIEPVPPVEVDEQTIEETDIGHADALAELAEDSSND